MQRNAKRATQPKMTSGARAMRRHRVPDRLVGLSVCLLLLFSNGSTAGSSTGQDIKILDTHAADESGSIIYWEEEIPTSRDDETSSDVLTPSRRRRWLWNGRVDEGQQSWGEEDLSNDDATPKPNRSKKSTAKKPHPLRTDVWQLTVSAPSKHARQLLGTDTHNKTLTMEFSENGFVRVDRSSSANTKDDIGKWKQLPSGLSWHVPVYQRDHPTTPVKTVLHYSADIILNPFGTCPHMVRGTVTRDRYDGSWVGKQWFRPVVATFTAKGIGNDTADTSYRERRIGLSTPSSKSVDENSKQ